MKTFRLSVIDLSSLPYFPARMKAAADVHRSLDHYHDVRQIMGLALAPPVIRITSLAPGEGILLATEIS
jgi:hypothetical protein